MLIKIKQLLTFFHSLSFLHFPESPTVMLAAGSFSSPYEHLSQPETKRMVEHYTAYLSDNTRLIANPGLKVALSTQTWWNIGYNTHTRNQTLALANASFFQMRSLEIL